MGTKIADFDPEEDKYMAISVNYRGTAKAKKANACVQWLKTNKKVSFVEWCPTGFKVGLNDKPPAVLEEDDLGAAKDNITFIGNNTAISRVFSERISKKYDLMYSQRAFVHWYVGEGMEEGESQRRVRTWPRWRKTTRRLELRRLKARAKRKDM